MRKKLAVILALALALTALSGAVFAAGPDMDAETAAECAYLDLDAVPEYAHLDLDAAAEYAYMDLDAAPEELHQKILDARNVIIYSKSWTVDGQCAITCPDGSVQPLPEFSDLFPGWDVPGVGEAA